MESGETQPIIVLEHVSKSFDGKSIIKDISFSLREGELFGLIGPSGSGKTTILRTLMGFYAPDEGRVLFKGIPVTNVEDLTREVGFATQDECFYDDLTCDENMRYFGALYKIPAEILDTRITTLLDTVELTLARGSFGKHLSGGVSTGRLPALRALPNEGTINASVSCDLSDLTCNFGSGCSGRSDFVITYYRSPDETLMHTAKGSAEYIIASKGPMPPGPIETQ